MAIGGIPRPRVKVVYDSESKEFKAHQYLEREMPDTSACMFWLRNRRPDLWKSNPTDDGLPADGAEPERVKFTIEIRGKPDITHDELHANNFYDRQPPKPVAPAPPLKVIGPADSEG
jgi:hypothetical protein